MRILVTDAHELAGLGAVRSLGRAGHRVTAGFPDRLGLPPSSFSRWCSASRAYPDAWASQQAFASWLLTQAADFDFILPISEAALVATMGVRNVLPRTVTAVLPPEAALRYTLSKRQATAHALAIGLDCPVTAFEAEAAVNLPPPWIVRSDNRLMADGSYRKGRTWFVADRDELVDLIEELSEAGAGWIVQQPIVGVGTGGFLLRYGGRTLLRFAHQRVHEVPFYGGVSSLRRSTRDAPALDAAERLLASIGYEGAAMVEFRRCRTTGRSYFVEINGRLWGSLALALHAGVDFPAQLIACYANAAPQTPEDYPELSCRNVYPAELDWLRSVFTAGGPVRGVSPPSKTHALLEFFALFLDPRVRYDYLWLSDPKPWVRQSCQAVAHIVRSRSARWRRARRENALQRKFARRTSTGPPDMRSVLFVCYGNICRSAFAASYWNQRIHEGNPARSTGFVTEADRRTPARIVRLARHFGVDLRAHRSRVIDPNLVEQASAIFVMDGQNIADLLKSFPQAAGKTWLLGPFAGAEAIHDPYTLPDEPASRSLRQIRDSIDALAGRAVQPGTGLAPPPVISGLK